MIRHTLRQLMAMRHRNVWIFVELLVVFVIGAYILDYAVNLSFNYHLAPGYDTRGVYIVVPRLDGSLGDLPPEQYLREVRQTPGVRYAMHSNYYNLLPNDGGMSLQSLDKDDGEVVYSRAKRVSDTAYFHIMDIRSCITGEVARMSMDEPTAIISQDLAELFFPGVVDPRGQLINVGGDKVKVTDVIPCIKDYDYGRPERVFFLKDPHESRGIGRLIIKVTEPFDRADFEERFGPLTSMDEHRKGAERIDGITQRLYMQKGIALFFGLSIALGVIGVLWFRTQRRKGEIGLRRALGSSTRRIEAQLVLEPLVLLTLAALPAMLLGWLIAQADLLPQVINTEHIDQMLEALDGTMPAPETYWIDTLWMRFAFVQGLTFVVLAIIVALSAYLPARLAAKESPVDALRSE